MWCLLGYPTLRPAFRATSTRFWPKKLDVFVIVYLDEILIYTEDKKQGHMEAVQWVLDFLKKNGFFANLKKCRFNQDKVRFLGYVVSTQKVQMEDERIAAVRNWPKPKSIKDI